jgi:hypothetical protein
MTIGVTGTGSWFNRLNVMVYVSLGSVEMEHVLDLIQLFVPGTVSEIGLAWSEEGWDGYG